jgi:hypothetical protein
MDNLRFGDQLREVGSIFLQTFEIIPSASVVLPAQKQISARRFNAAAILWSIAREWPS